MLFNSFEFAIFLPIVFILYWFVFNKNFKLQNFFIVVISYIFYGWWNWKFLILIALTSFVSWSSGLLIEYFENRHLLARKYNWAKVVSVSNIVINLVVLGFFK